MGLETELIDMRAYDFRIQEQAAKVIQKPTSKLIQLTQEKLKSLEMQDCVWCGISFRGKFDCMESMRDELFDCEFNHGPFCRFCWGEFNDQCIHCDCSKCGVQLSTYIESYEEVFDEIFDCHNNHGPFCRQCWQESSNRCPEKSNNNCPSAPVAVDIRTKCGYCGQDSYVTSQNCCSICRRTYEVNSEGVVTSRDLDKNLKHLKEKWDDKLRVLEVREKFTYHMYFWCVICSVYTLSELDSRDPNLSIYLASFLLGWFFFWPFIGLLDMHMLNVFCKLLGYEMVYRPQLTSAEKSRYKQQFWCTLDRDYNNLASQHYKHHSLVNKERYKFLKGLEQEWFALRFLSTLIPGIVILLLLSVLDIESFGIWLNEHGLFMGDIK